MSDSQTANTQNSEESVIWEGSQSQIVNFGHFILVLIAMILIILLSTVMPARFKGFTLLLLIIPVFYAVWKYLEIRFIHYKVTSQRIMASIGVFSKDIETMELYRVRDYELFQPLLMRLFGKGTIKIISADVSTPDFYIKAIPNTKGLLDKIRTAVEARRDTKRVRGVEFEQ